MGERMTVRLVGGGPWGFRLQGGSGAPLTVSKIRRKSRAQHHLVEGDRILSINGVPCDSFTYDQAMGVVDAADNTLNIEIIRGGAAGKENRDPSAPTHQPKEVTAKEKPKEHATTVKTKPMEPAFQPSGLRPQVPKQADTTPLPAPAPVSKTPPPPPPPKPIVCPAPPLTLPPVQIPEAVPSNLPIISSSSEITSSTTVSEVRSVLQETKSFTVSSDPWVPPKEKPALPQDLTSQNQGVPAFASAPVTKPIEVPPQVSAPPSKPPEEVLDLQAPLAAETTSRPEPKPMVPPVTQKAEPIVPEVPPVFQDATPKILALAPELEALAPELAALESEIAAFKSAPSPELIKHVEPGQSQRRQEVSLETTSDGQRYHSLTSETSSWSTGPQHKASAFQQQEETRQISSTADQTSSHVKTIKAETKKEIRMSQSEFSSSSSTAQKQLSPEMNVDALSWRPTSPIFSQPIRPPGVTPADRISMSPTPPQNYQVSKAPVKEAPVSAVWSPPSTSAPKPQEQKKKKKAPPPTLPKPSRSGQGQARPTSAPPRDYDIWEPFSDTELVYKDSSSRTKVKATNLSGLTSVSSGAVSDSEDWHHAYTSEDEMGSTSLFTRRKKMFSSSSFYEEPHSIYPTVEEQVELARKIAGSLSNDNNRKSRGANMFFKRVKRSHTWIHEGPDPYSDGGTTDTDMEPTTPDPGSGPYIKVSSGPPKLKLILDPRQLQDLVKLRNSGLNPVEHTAVSPDICLDLVRDLNSPRGKGAALFAKRKQKAEEWVVDEQKVKQQMAQKEAEVAQLQEEAWIPKTPSIAAPGTILVQNRLKLIKSPWEAALESPIGSCDAAFVELPPVISSVASSIIRAAENKARITPAAPTYTEPPFVLQPDVYKPKAPRGWVGPATGSVPPMERNDSPLPPSREAPVTSVRTSSGAPRPLSFHDFNTTARSWSSNHGLARGHSFRHVAPPSAFK